MKNTLKTDLYKHQKENLDFGLKLGSFILGDDMGIGKTLSALAIALIQKERCNYKRCLIITCVNELKFNWKDEILRHTDAEYCIIGTRMLKNGKEVVGSIKDRLADLKSLKNEYFVITNIDTIKDESINKELVRLIKLGEINMIVVDEIHKLSNHTSQRAKGLFRLHCETQMVMSGTLFVNKPLDSYIPINWLGYIDKSTFRTFTAYRDYFCIYGGYNNVKVIGYKNLDVLANFLKTIMIRHRKCDVLDLPPKIYKTEYIELSPNERKLYKRVDDSYAEKIKELVEEEEIDKWELVRSIRLKQIVGCPSIVDKTVKETSKLDRLLDLVLEIKDGGRKCIIFSNWTKITREIKKRLEANNIKCAYVTGEVRHKEEEIKRFKSEKDCTVIIGTTSVLGTGFNLTEADTVIFYEQPTSPAHKLQAEDRAYRMGTTESVLIISIIVIDTKDMHIVSSNLRKSWYSKIIQGE